MDNEYTLDSAEKAMVDAVDRELQTLIRDKEAILRGIIRSHGLQGNWSWNGDKFTRGK